MNDQSDSQLLRAYADHGSEAAFAELVRRHIDFVYSAARRMVCDPHLAEDVAQGVFVALAKSARRVAERPVISGWLHRTAQNIAAQTVRTIERRRAREQHAASMNPLLADVEPDSTWEKLAPQLDSVLGELNETDRDALLLRYFERKSAREMAQLLGTTEEAAQKRVNRAVDRLRVCFSKRDLTVSAAALTTLISTHAVQAAPLGLIKTISISIAAIGAHAPAALAATKAIAMTTLQKVVVGTTLTIAIGAGIYEAQEASRLRSQLQSLHQSGAPATEARAQLERDLAGAREQLAALQTENEQLRRDNAELYKLRGEVPRLRNDSRELTQLKTNPAADATISEALQWKERVKLLKQYVERNPSAAIPELQLATEQDWLDAARFPIRTEKDYRSAISSLRGRMESRFSGTLYSALQKYLKANGNQFPTDVSQLLPFFRTPVDPAILQRYSIFPQDAIPSLGFGNRLISQIAPVDKEFDGRIGVGANGYGSTGNNGWNDPESDPQRIERALRRVIAAYAAANGGRQPSEPSDLLPYLSTPEEKAAYERGLKLLKEQEE